MSENISIKVKGKKNPRIFETINAEILDESGIPGIWHIIVKKYPPLGPEMDKKSKKHGSSNASAYWFQPYDTPSIEFDKVIYLTSENQGQLTGETKVDFLQEKKN